MLLVADESVDAPIYRLLREQGHSIYAIVENNAGISDDQVLDIAVQHKAILITQDKDFGELVYRLGKAHYGILLLRLAGMRPGDKAMLTALVIQQHFNELSGAFMVVFKDYVKIRKG